MPAECFSRSASKMLFHSVPWSICTAFSEGFTGNESTLILKDLLKELML